MKVLTVGLRFEAPDLTTPKHTTAERAERRLAVRPWLAELRRQLQEQGRFTAAMQAVAATAQWSRVALLRREAEAKQAAAMLEAAMRAREEELVRRVAEASACSYSEALDLIDDLKRRLGRMTAEEAVRVGRLIAEAAAGDTEEPWKTQTTGSASSGSSWPGHQRTRSSPHSGRGRGRRSPARSTSARRSKKRGRRRGR